MIFTAQPETLSALWPYALPHVQKFVSRTMLTTPEDLYREVYECQKQLWMHETDGEVSCAVLTSINDTQRGSICCVWGAGGEAGIEPLLAILAEIEKWARSIGCVAVEVTGRKGWKRVLPDFKETGVLLEKDLRTVN